MGSADILFTFELDFELYDIMLELFELFCEIRPA